jgi:uncharacterized membrane protein
MMTGAAVSVALLALVLTGAMAGIFLAFSISVLPGLDRLGAERAVAGMRALNDAIQTPPFLATFLGAPVAAGAAAAPRGAAGGGAAAWLMLGACAVYLFGAFAPTVVVNVPLNNALAEGDEPRRGEQARLFWADFSPRWRRWNTVRGVSSVLGLALTGAALVLW